MYCSPSIIGCEMKTLENTATKTMKKKSMLENIFKKTRKKRQRQRQKLHRLCYIVYCLWWDLHFFVAVLFRRLHLCIQSNKQRQTMLFVYALECRSFVFFCCPHYALLWWFCCRANLEFLFVVVVVAAILHDNQCCIDDMGKGIETMDRKNRTRWMRPAQRETLQWNNNGRWEMNVKLCTATTTATITTTTTTMMLCVI